MIVISFVAGFSGPDEIFYAFGKTPVEARQAFAELFAECFYICANGLDMATTRFYLDLRGRAKDGKGSVLITITHNRTVATVPTGVRVAPNTWDGSNVVRIATASVFPSSP